MTTKLRTHWLGLIVWLAATLAQGQPLSWEKLPALPEARYGHAAVTWKNTIVVLGGRDAQHNALATVLQFNFDTMQWAPFAANLQAPRYNAPALVYRNQIYVLGGNRNEQILDTAERFDEQTGRWEVLASRLRIGREGPAAAVFNDTLFVLGGFDNANQYQKTVEHFTPAANVWTTAAWQLTQARAALSALTWRDTLYTFGGFFFGPVARLERYHSARGEQLRASMRQARGNMAAALFQNRLWALGGTVQSGLTQAVESYDPAKGLWQDELALTFPRESHAAVVLGEKLYVIGGLNAEAKALGDFEILSAPTLVAEDEQQTLPTSFVLLSFPNPFVAQVQFQITNINSRAAVVHAEIFALDGMRVRTLQLTQARAYLQTTWNGRDDNGHEVSNGTYFFVVRAGLERVTKKILKLSIASGGRR